MTPDRNVPEKFHHFGSMQSPAACPKCGSMDLMFPFQGRRTNLWLSRCRDCGTPIRSTTYFEITPRRQLGKYKRFVQDPEPQPTRPIGTMLMAAAIRAGEPLQTEWLPYREREPGEEG